MFSIIIPTKNGSNQLVETIENIKYSLTKFQYEVIIINDGSNDNTQKLLKNYQNDSHFKIIHQTNKGVAAARNAGINHISEKSKYVVFIDDSDKVEYNFFEKIHEHFKKNKYIDVISTPLIRTSNNLKQPHSLNYRFNSDIENVNILKDFKYIQFHIGGMAFRKEIFKNNSYRFDESMHFWEDAKLINDILLDKKYYGLVSDTAYLYNNENPNSLSKSAWQLKERYLSLINDSYFYLIDKSIEKYNTTIKYVQYLIATHYIEFLRKSNQDIIMNSPYFNSYEFFIASQKLFKHIDRDIIYSLNTQYIYKNYMLNLKGERLDINDFIDQSSIHIQSFNPISRIITFTFSESMCTVPVESKVHLEYMKRRKKEVSLVENNSFSILGELQEDFSRNLYKVKLPLISLFTTSRILIINENIEFKIDNPSIFNRVITNLLNLYKIWRK